MRKALFIVTSNDKLGDTGKTTGCYFSEMAIPYQELIDDGFVIDIVSPKGGPVPIIGLDRKDPLTLELISDSRFMYKIENSLTPDMINPLDYNILFFPGGHGTMWDLPDNKQINEITRIIYENGGIVGAVCHGPAGIVNVKLSNDKYLVQNKIVTSFSNTEEYQQELQNIVPFLLETRLIENGAYYAKAPPGQVCVKVSERLITGQNPASTKKLTREMLNLMKISV